MKPQLATPFVGSCHICADCTALVSVTFDKILGIAQMASP